MLERTSLLSDLSYAKWIILSSLSWQKHGLDKMAQHPVQMILKVSRVGKSTTSPWRLCQWLIALIVNKIYFQ